MSFAENFKTARKAAKLSQQQIADERGVSTPNLKHLPKISQLLGISIDELLK